MSGNPAKLMVGVGISSSAASGADPVTGALRAEELGFDFVSTSDHPLGDGPTYEAQTLLTWIAARTSRIHIVSRVFGVPFRNPGVLAKAAESLQRLSGGRLVLGLGGGYSDDEIHRLGAGRLTPGQKVDGLADALTILRGAWSQDRFTYAGRRHAVFDLTLEPKPAVPPPLWLGTYGNRALEVTGRLADGWIPSLGFAPPHRIPGMRQRILQAAAEAGRDPDAVRCVYNVGVRIGTRLPGQDTVTGRPAEVAERLTELAELGFAGFNVIPAGPDPDDQLRRFAGEVLPVLRAVSGQSV